MRIIATMAAAMCLRPTEPLKFRAAIEEGEGVSIRHHPVLLVETHETLEEACARYIIATGLVFDCVASVQEQYLAVTQHQLPSNPERLFPELVGETNKRITKENPWWRNLSLTACLDRPTLLSIAAHRWPEAKASKTQVVVEVGAHEGIDTAVYASLPTVSQVVAFEPTEAKTAAIKRAVFQHAGRHGLTKLTVRPVAVSNISCQAPLFTPDTSGSDMTNALSSMAFVFGNNRTAPELVQVVTLDEELGVEAKIALLELDIQGHELLALVGAHGILRRQGVDVLAIEFYPSGARAAHVSPHEILDFLAAVGYDCFDCREFSDEFSARPFDSRKVIRDPAALVDSLGEYIHGHGDHGEWTDLICFPDESRKGIDETEFYWKLT